MMSFPDPKTILKDIEKKLITYRNNGFFSASSVAVFKGGSAGGTVFTISCGTTDDSDSKEIDEKSLFDLASLTKPIVTLLSILVLIEKEKLDWTDTVASILPEVPSKQYQKVTVFELLSHSSGLPPHRNYWTKLKEIDEDKRRQWLIQAILNEPNAYKRGEQSLYSDLGYILLGYIVEEVSKRNLAQFWKESIAQPTGVEKQLLFPCSQSLQELVFVATRTEGNTLLDGVVHDDNCRSMGGICGHAGLFGTASGVLRLCREVMRLMRGEKSSLPLSSSIIQKSCLQVGESDWTAGYSIPSKESSSGSYFSDQSRGHLGFTGTSFWIDPVKELIIVFLTNRVIKGDNGENIKLIRPEIHDLIVEQLGV